MQQAIGVFDSGVGGLSVLKALQKQLPNEQFIYVADSAYAPYGQLNQSNLEKRYTATSKSHRYCL